MQPKGYRKSQSRIVNTEAPQFVGAGECTDNPDLSTLEVIDPDAKGSKEGSQQSQGPILEVFSGLGDITNDTSGETSPLSHLGPHHLFFRAHAEQAINA